MADSLDSFHGTKAKSVNPYCESCHAKGLNVTVCRFSKDCVQFQCTDCHGVHGNLQACRHHDVVQGKDMPKLQADKPLSFYYCDVHPKLLKFQFCCDHKILLCSLCSSYSHKSCPMKTVGNVCKPVDDSEKVSALKQTTAQPTVGQASGKQYLGAQPEAAQTPGTQKLGVSAAKPLLPRSIQSLLHIKSTKQDTFNITQTDKRYRSCDITGIAISKDRRILMTDYLNRKVKMFSHDLPFLSSVTVAPDRPWNIVVMSNTEAAVTSNYKSLVILDISGGRLSIKITQVLYYDVRGICRYNNKLHVTSGGRPSSVKLIDQTGRVNWSVSSDQHGQPLFYGPLYVSSHGDGRSSTVIVTDNSNSTLTLLNGNTGEVITRRQLKGRKDPRGVTTDSSGNVYVCCWFTSEVAVLSGDLSEEKILLSRQDGLSILPQAIVYDGEAHQLIISNLQSLGCDVDRFQLS